MKQFRDAVINDSQMIIIKKFDVTVNYLYPLLNNAPRIHGALRDAIFAAIFEQVNLFIKAGKSNQKSKLYMCDAGLANIRYLLRFATNSNRKLLSKKQHEIALIQIAECGAMLNTWIKKAK